MDLHFHHLGMACRNIAAELPELAIVGYRPEGPIFEDPIQQVRIQFVSGGGPRLELIEPADAQSPVQGILEARRQILSCLHTKWAGSTTRSLTSGSGSIFPYRHPRPRSRSTCVV